MFDHEVASEWEDCKLTYGAMLLMVRDKRDDSDFKFEAKSEFFISQHTLTTGEYTGDLP
jgi:hypothetical protein